MSDQLTREFRAQLTTAMDSIMRRTMFEVMKIFENSLSDFKLELVNKEEEIAHLKVKLQNAEIRLNDVKGSDNKVEEKNTSQKNQLDKDPDRVPHLAEQPSIVPEFDFEVPDDWCAPLGSEIVPNKDNECPSVRLRKLYIPLWHVPIVKQEVDRHPIDTHQHPSKRGRKKKSGNTVKAELRNTLDRRPFKAKQRKKKKTKKVYTCSLCEKNFDSHCGLKIHARSHICCKGCKKVLPSKLVFNSHKLTCRKYKKFTNRRGQPSKQKETISSSCMPSMSHNKNYIVHEKTLKCSLCPRTFQLNKALKLHMTRIHLKKKKLNNTNDDSSWTMPLELTDTSPL